MAETILRAASPDDAGLLSKLDVAVWRASYDGILSREILDALDRHPHHDSAFFASILDRGGVSEWIWLVERSGEPVGFCHFGLCRAAGSGYGGEVERLYLVPSAQGLGLGTRIMGAAARRLVAERLTPIRTTVFEANARARRFYERLGAEEVGRQIAFEDQGRPVWERVYGWPDAAPLMALCEAGVGKPQQPD